jgi:hypothetical protein
MENTEFKAKFDNIQRLFDRCINHAYETLEKSLYLKSKYLNVEQMEELERQEYIRVADELANLYMRYSALSEIQRCYFIHDFFWESGFYETIKPDEKRKYLTFSAVSFDYSRYEQDNMAYDEELPYFSVVVKAIVLERYLADLKVRKEYKLKEVVITQEEPIKQEQVPDIIEVEKTAPPVATMENPFESVLNDEQMEYLAECINEVKMFNASVSADDLRAIFACKPNTILKSKNNRYVAYFFAELGYRELITSNWQSVIGNNKLFISSQKDSFLNQSDLSSATNNVREVDIKGKYAIIERYLKQVKKL